MRAKQEKQSWIGISRRHTQSTKIAQGLQSAKYSLLKYPKNPNVGPNWRAGRGPFFGFFEHPFWNQDTSPEYAGAKSDNHRRQVDAPKTRGVHVQKKYPQELQHNRDFIIDTDQ